MSIKVHTFRNNECLELKESSCIILYLYIYTTDKNNLWTAPVDFSRTRSQLNRHWLRLLIYFFHPFDSFGEYTYNMINLPVAVENPVEKCFLFYILRRKKLFTCNVIYTQNDS